MTSKFDIHPPNIVDTTDERGAPRKVTTFTLKGRFEFAKDGQAVMSAASKVLFVSGLTITYKSAEISWGLGFDGEVNPDALAKVKEVVAEFTALLIADYKNPPENLKGKGVEAHMFIESLKPLDEFDGDRDGPLGDFRAQK